MKAMEGYDRKENVYIINDSAPNIFIEISVSKSIISQKDDTLGFITFICVCISTISGRSTRKVVLKYICTERTEQ